MKNEKSRSHKNDRYLLSDIRDIVAINPFSKPGERKMTDREILVHVQRLIYDYLNHPDTIEDCK